MREIHVYDMIVVGGGPAATRLPSMPPGPDWILWSWRSSQPAARWP